MSSPQSGEVGGSGLAVPGDVGVPSDVERAVATAVAEFGALHYGVNNAGMSGYFETVADLSLEKWTEVYRHRDDPGQP
jgi:NAD(P)-dependent dehydrogenase (short-subunit alcohol dehydrogenase family)